MSVSEKSRILYSRSPLQTEDKICGGRILGRAKGSASSGNGLGSETSEKEQIMIDDCSKLAEQILSDFLLVTAHQLVEEESWLISEGPFPREGARR